MRRRRDDDEGLLGAIDPFQGQWLGEEGPRLERARGSPLEGERRDERYQAQWLVRWRVEERRGIVQREVDRHREQARTDEEGRGLGNVVLIDDWVRFGLRARVRLELRLRGLTTMAGAASDWITLAEAADLLAAANVRFRRETIGGWARSGKLQSIKIGGRRFVRRGEVRALLTPPRRVHASDLQPGLFEDVTG